MRAIIGTIGAVLVLTGCGGTVTTEAAPASSAPSAAPASTAVATPSPVVTGPNVSGCFTEKDGEIFTHGDGLPGVITGKGKVGVVITYERNGNVCTWRPLSDHLVAAGYRVLLYARPGRDYPDEVAAEMAERLLKDVKRVFLVGGSMGATASVPAAEKVAAKSAGKDAGKDAGKAGSRVAGVVALSGAIDEGDAARISFPLLQIGSENDAYGGATDLARAHDAATKAPDNEVHVVKGESLHASALFGSPHGPQVLDWITDFMNRHAAPEKG
ncbi:alpha/beta hydrolase [Nonomuraea rhizosphaerae]|uniref:alpha/beta hydrolase n=1 Tax=Nonomuraea rhizosphaerae TaxID=2665663 RepID=UPI001C5FC063|nr:alpha/beta hydrolase [Nonomuraea rhizosphaerae]